jgi:hypothetical protein
MNRRSVLITLGLEQRLARAPTTVSLSLSLSRCLPPSQATHNQVVRGAHSASLLEV